MPARLGFAAQVGLPGTWPWSGRTAVSNSIPFASVGKLASVGLHLGNITLEKVSWGRAPDFARIKNLANFVVRVNETMKRPAHVGLSLSRLLSEQQCLISGLRDTAYEAAEETSKNGSAFRLAVYKSNRAATPLAIVVLQFASQKRRFFEDLDCSIEAQSLSRCRVRCTLAVSIFR